jgi:hypothetical protein
MTCLERLNRLKSHSPNTRTRVPTTEMTQARTTLTRFELEDDEVGGSGVEPSSTGLVAVGMESVLELSSVWLETNHVGVLTVRRLHWALLQSRDTSHLPVQQS